MTRSRSQAFSLGFFFSRFFPSKRCLGVISARFAGLLSGCFVFICSARHRRQTADGLVSPAVRPPLSDSESAACHFFRTAVAALPSHPLSSRQPSFLGARQEIPVSNFNFAMASSLASPSVHHLSYDSVLPHVHRCRQTIAIASKWLSHAVLLTAERSAARSSYGRRRNAFVVVSHETFRVPPQD